MPNPFAPLASRRHLTVLSAILLTIAGAGWLSLHAAQGRPGPGAAPEPWLYPVLIGLEAALLYYVVAGLRRAGTPLGRLVYDRPPARSRILVDVALGVLVFAALYAVADALGRLLGHGDATLVRPLVAGAAANPLGWIAVSAAAGLGEELTYRGYLQPQFTAVLRSPLLGLAVQAVLFGVTHGYQGPLAMLKITALGVVFGLVSMWRGSRVPGAVGHFMLDAVSGLTG